MRKSIFWLAGFICWISCLQGQHYPMYSQYMHNQAVINPGYTGSRDVLSTSLLFRQQWLGIQGAPSTQAFYLHSPLRNPRNNFGFNMVIDRLGVTYRNAFNVSYAYRIDLGEKKGRLAFGLQGGIASLQNRFRDVVTDESGDHVFGYNTPAILVPGVGFGAYYDTRRWYLGVSLPYLLEYHNAAFNLFVQNNDSIASSRPALLATGCVIRLNPDILLRPSILAKFVPNSPVQMDLNAHLIIKDQLWLGASYRTGDALVGLIGYQITPQFKIGYSYDQAISPLRKYNNGSHELMVRYEFGYRLKVMSPRYF
ncbi:MAG: type IX secretion system membrane protein PorP/SprF [Bacteroidetes bacterium]|nr:type IX secretion system membrane protein PorP/SprF [Bacteroidota bacterium]